MGRMQPLKNVMPRALAGMVAAAPLTPGKVSFAWRLAVGAGVERQTSVRLEQGVILVEAASPQWADAVQRSSRTIVARLRELLGELTVRGLEVRVR